MLRRFPIHFLLPLLLPLLLSGCTADSEETGGQVLVRGDLVVRHLLSGELEAEEAIPLVTPEVQNQPVEIRWLEEDGAEVAEGDVLVELDNSSLVSAVDETRVRLVEAGNALVNARADAAREIEQASFTVAEKQVALQKARLEADVPEELVPSLEYQELQLGLRRAELELKQARRELETARSKGAKEVEIREIEVRKAQADLQETLEGIEVLSLAAPQNGIFLVGESRRDERKYQPGDPVWTGETLARLPNLATMIVRARLYDVDDGRIGKGMPATVTLDAFPDLALEAEIREIDQLAQQVTRESTRRSFAVLLDLQTVDLERMRPGMSVQVAVEQTVAEDVLLAPRESLAIGEGADADLVLAGGERVPVVLAGCNARRCAVEAAEAGGRELMAGQRLGRTGEESL